MRGVFAGVQLSGEWVETGSGPRDKWLEFDFNGKKAFVWAGNLSLKDAAETKNYDSALAEESSEEVSDERDALERKCGVLAKEADEEKWREYLSCWGSYANENYDDQQLMKLLDNVYEVEPRNWFFLTNEIDLSRRGPICEAALKECAMAGDPMFCFEQRHPYWYSQYQAAGGCLNFNF